MSETQPEEIMSIKDVEYLESTLTEIAELKAKILELQFETELGKLSGNDLSKLDLEEKASKLLKIEGYRLDVARLTSLNQERCYNLYLDYTEDFVDLILSGARKVYTLTTSDISFEGGFISVIADMFKSYPDALNYIFEKTNDLLKESQRRKRS